MGTEHTKLALSWFTGIGGLSVCAIDCTRAIFFSVLLCAIDCTNRLNKKLFSYKIMESNDRMTERIPSSEICICAFWVGQVEMWGKLITCVIFSIYSSKYVIFYILQTQLSLQIDTPYRGVKPNVGTLNQYFLWMENLIKFHTYCSYNFHLYQNWGIVNQVSFIRIWIEIKVKSKK